MVAMAWANKVNDADDEISRRCSLPGPYGKETVSRLQLRARDRICGMGCQIVAAAPQLEVLVERTRTYFRQMQEERWRPATR
jgi:hypothetical protein